MMSKARALNLEEKSRVSGEDWEVDARAIKQVRSRVWMQGTEGKRRGKDGNVPVERLDDGEALETLVVELLRVEARALLRLVGERIPLAEEDSNGRIDVRLELADGFRLEGGGKKVSIESNSDSKEGRRRTAKVCETILRLRVCSPRSRVLKRPRFLDATKASSAFW